MKVCYKCKVKKSESDFAKHHKRPDGLNGQCKQCQKEYKDLHYKNNKALYLLKAKAYDDKVRKQFDDYKSTLRCIKCGFSHFAALDFHHRDANEKEFSISEGLLIKGYSLDRLKLEIAKCDVLCANCHRIHHYEVRYASG